MWIVAANAVELARREVAVSAQSPYEMQANVLRRLLQSYFEIVRKKIQDSVPKAIILKLVNKVRPATTARRSALPEACYLARLPPLPLPQFSCLQVEQTPATQCCGCVGYRAGNEGAAVNPDL